MTTGKLVLAGKKKKKTLLISFTNRKGKSVRFTIKEAALSASLRALKINSPEQLDGMEVELQEVGGQATKIRPVGEEWKDSEIESTQQNRNLDNRVNPSRRETTKQVATSSGHVQGDFHNPYNFTPALPRGSRVQKTELGDRAPAGHGAYHNNLWSGHIKIKLTTKTPLLIPDGSKSLEDEQNHKTFPLRIGADNLPLLPATSIKGMLRSAYEIVTNSRLSVFENHSDRLCYRMPAKVLAEPARISEISDEGLTIQILESVRLKYYKAVTKPKYSNGDLPQHEDTVWVKVDNASKVSQIRRRGVGSMTGWRKGWACITGRNIKGKSFERVFVEPEGGDILTLSKEEKDYAIGLWRDLILNYKAIHQKDLKSRQARGIAAGAYLGDDPGDTGWSRHIYEGDEETLKVGTLCYVETDSNDNVTALLPVTISRHLYETSPESLLSEALHPPQSINLLSPADRVFGWVRRADSTRTEFKTAYKGNLRISSVKCLASSREAVIKEFRGDGLPLAILATPKPEQARFYIAKDDSGTPLDSGIDKAQGYRQGQGLRGRKVYPHHRGLPKNHWSDPTRDRTQTSQDGHFQEYRRPKKGGVEQRDDQNRSIQGWVEPDVSFSARIDITNLSNVELGALLYLLNLPENHFHRLGGGRPLGFGSVHIEIDKEQSDMRRGNDWRSFYEVLDLTQLDIQTVDFMSTINAFREEVETAYGGAFDGVSFIQSFSQAATGFADKKPVHYPRVRPKGTQANPSPHPEGESFKWFTENERTGKNGGEHLSLPSLLDETGLPYLNDKERSS